MKIFADGADVDYIKKAPSNVVGFTTNPSLIRAAGITDYREFAKSALAASRGLPISFEVIADDPVGMVAEAREIASWGKNVYVKIPVVTTRGEFNGDVVGELIGHGIPVNVTAVMTLEQVVRLRKPLASATTPAIVSVFAGRVGDTGREPSGAVFEAICTFWAHRNVEILWASSRSAYDVRSAELCGCHIITLTPALIDKLKLRDKDLDEYSVETVQQFRRDALASGLSVLADRAVVGG